MDEDRFLNDTGHVTLISKEVRGIFLFLLKQTHAQTDKSVAVGREGSVFSAAPRGSRVTCRGSAPAGPPTRPPQPTMPPCLADQVRFGCQPGLLVSEPHGICDASIKTQLEQKIGFDFHGGAGRH